MRAELRELALRLPIPVESWHPYVRLIAAVRDELLEELEQVDDDRLAAVLEGPVPPATPGSALAALPVPEGQHPFLDEILPVLEAAAYVQAAGSLVV
jgi:hypothetical protein